MPADARAAPTGKVERATSRWANECTYVTRVLDDSPGSARIALICHSGVIRVLVAYALELGPANRGCIGGNEHGALSVLRIRKGKWSLRLYNDACHLRAGDASSTTSKGRAPHARGR
jgi:broad specificity phosphatase PhoE